MISYSYLLPNNYTLFELLFWSALAEKINTLFPLRSAAVLREWVFNFIYCLLKLVVKFFDVFKELLKQMNTKINLWEVILFLFKGIYYFVINSDYSRVLFWWTHSLCVSNQWIPYVLKTFIEIKVWFFYKYIENSWFRGKV